MNIETIFEETQKEYEKGVVLFMDAMQLGQKEKVKELADQLYEIGETQYKAALLYVELIEDLIKQEKDLPFKRLLGNYKKEMSEMVQDYQDWMNLFFQVQMGEGWF